MKLRWEPVVVALAAAAVWLVLDARRVPSRSALAPEAPQEHAGAMEKLAQPLGGPPAPEGPRATRQDARAEAEPDAAVVSAPSAGIPRGRLPLGVTEARDVVVPRHETAGSIRGWVQSRSGDPLPGTLIRLRPLDRPRRTDTRLVAMSSSIRAKLRSEGIERDPHFVSGTRNARPFFLENVPAGRYELSVFTAERYATSPASFHVQAPAEDLVFIVEDAVGADLNLIQVLDPQSRAVPVRTAVTFRVEGGPVENASEANWDMHLIELAPGVAFEWLATAPGYRTARGTEEDFRLRGDLPVDKSFPAATCALRRGFGAQLVVQDGRDRSGLARAEILADGDVVAATDEMGVAVLDLDRAPRKIDVRMPGWRVLDPSWPSEDVLAYPPTRVLMVRE